MNIEQLVRANVRSLVPFSSARSEFTGTAEVFLDANENPYENGMNRYPDPYQKELKQEIAKWKNTKAEYIFLGNGSDEIIDILIRVFCTPTVDRIRYIHPSFSMYRISAEINDVDRIAIPLTTDFGIDVEACLRDQQPEDKILFLCSPNNPTGNSYSREILETLIKGWKGIVVVDEAYIDFSDEPSLIDSIEQYDNLVILQTFSKAMGGAGLRLGMAFANEELLSYMNKIKAPYNIGTETQKRAMELLANRSQIDTQIQTVLKERKSLKTQLEAMDLVLQVHRSDANFLLVQFEDPIPVMRHLIEKGVIVRDRSKEPGCSGCLRFTVGLPIENKRLIEALKTYKS